jgi:hypothetical protein
MGRALAVPAVAVLNRTAHSRTAPHRVVQRGQTVWASAHGETVPVIAPRVGLSALRLRAWIRRLTRKGLAG